MANANYYIQPLDTDFEYLLRRMFETGGVPAVYAHNNTDHTRNLIPVPSRHVLGFVLLGKYPFCLYKMHRSRAIVFQRKHTPHHMRACDQMDTPTDKQALCIDLQERLGD